MNSSNWLYSLYSQYPDILLNDIILPATHDSATGELNKYTISPETGYDIKGFYKDVFKGSLEIDQIKNVLFKIAITQFPSNQTAFITDQANKGVRAFDLRLYFDKNGNALYQHGTVVWKTLVIYTFRHFQTLFRNMNNNEVFIFHLSHLKGKYSITDLVNLLNNIQMILSDALRPRGSFNVPIGSLFQTPIIIILEIAGENANILKSTFPWLHITSECYDDDWSNAKQVNMTGTSLINYMKARFSEPPKSYIGIRELQAHYQFKPPPVVDIINKGDRAVDLKAITLRDNVNRAVVEYLKTPQAINCRSLSVVAFDFYTPDILQDILDINNTRLNILR